MLGESNLNSDSLKGLGMRLTVSQINAADFVRRVIFGFCASQKPTCRVVHEKR